METGKDVNNWYNSFSENQLATGINLRHYTIMEHLFNSGLKKNSTVLEIGCGIGTLTGLISKYLRKGKLVATDISDESIKIAKNRIPKSDKIDFFVTDMTNFDYTEKFDFIVLPDVLEHIPMVQHQDLFKVLSKLMHDQSIIIIHIPHPKALDYVRENMPEKLQIIDQSIEADTLMLNAYSNNLVLINYSSYSLFNEEPDYVLARFKKNSKSMLTPYSKSVIIPKKLLARIKFFYKTYLN